MPEIQGHRKDTLVNTHFQRALNVIIHDCLLDFLAMYFMF